jgi:hypothetical protein
MIGKLIATTILLLLAFYAFWGDALGGPPHDAVRLSVRVRH